MFIGHARQRHDLIGCSETRRLVLSQFVRCEHSHWNVGLRVHNCRSSVQFSLCAMNKALFPPKYRRLNSEFISFAETMIKPFWGHFIRTPACLARVTSCILCRPVTDSFVITTAQLHVSKTLPLIYVRIIVTYLFTLRLWPKQLVSTK